MEDIYREDKYICIGDINWLNTNTDRKNTWEKVKYREGRYTKRENKHRNNIFMKWKLIKREDIKVIKTNKKRIYKEKILL